MEHFENLTGKFDVSSYYEGTINSCTVDGKLYGVPFGANCLALYYNEDMLNDAGCEVPMFATDIGVINYILRSLHLISKNIEWLTTPRTAMFTLICANVWIGILFNMILILTGLTTIPKELYENASIDGANKVQTFFNITLPLLKPTIESVLILGFIYMFKVYDLVYVMTSGGPVNSTQGSAVANVLLLILLIVGVFYIKTTTNGEEE